MRTRVIIKRGKITMDVLDGQGAGCTKATESYVEHLRSGDEPELRFKPEYHEPGEGQERVTA